MIVIQLRTFLRLFWLALMFMPLFGAICAYLMIGFILLHQRAWGIASEHAGDRVGLVIALLEQAVTWPVWCWRRS